MPKKSLASIARKLSQSERFKGSFSIFISFMFRLIFQGIYFVILARSFAPERYGAYVGIVAIVSVFIPFSSWGSEKIIIQNVSRDRNVFREYWGTGILKTLIFGSFLISLILIIYRFIPISGISIKAVFLITFAATT